MRLVGLLLLATSLYGQTAFRLAVGKPTSYTDHAGNIWSADASGACTGSAYSAGSVTGTLDPTLYQYGRYDTQALSCTFTNVPIGVYRVTFKYAETRGATTGRRIFNVFVNETRVGNAFDIYSLVGANRAYDLVVPYFAVLETTVALRVAQQTGSPQINGISLENVGLPVSPVYDVTSYGAVFDGVTGIATHVQDAINAASAAGGGAVVMPAGTGNLDGPITIPNNVRLRGAGFNTTSLTWTGGNVDAITITGQYASIEGFTIGAASAGAAGYAVVFHDASHARMQQVRIWEMHSGVKLDGVYEVYIEGSYIQSYGGTASPATAEGVLITGHSIGVRINSTMLYGGRSSCTVPTAIPKYGVHITYGEGIYMQQVENSCNGAGLYMDPGAGQVVENIYWTDSVSDFGSYPGASGIMMIPSGSGYIRKVFINHAWSCTNPYHGILMDSTACGGPAACVYGIHIDDSYIGNNIRNGISIAGNYVGYVKMQGNTIQNNSVAPSTPGDYHGIYIANGAYLYVTENILGFASGDTQGYGLYIAGGTHALSVIGNSFGGNATGALYEFQAPDVSLSTFSGNAGVDISETTRDKTAAIASGNLYANIPAGTYRVSAYIHNIVTSAGACTSNVSIGWDWYPGASSKTLISAFDQAVSNNSGDGSAFIAVGVGNSANLTRAVSLSGADCSNAKYDVVFRVEKLQ